jgi:hypothetical protein
MRTLILVILALFLVGCTRRATEERNLVYSSDCDDARELVRDYTICAQYDYECARQVRYGRKTLSEQRCGG